MKMTESLPRSSSVGYYAPLTRTLTLIHLGERSMTSKVSNHFCTNSLLQVLRTAVSSVWTLQEANTSRRGNFRQLSQESVSKSSFAVVYLLPSRDRGNEIEWNSLYMRSMRQVAHVVNTFPNFPWAMTSFAHQKNLCKWGWGGSEIRLAIINCKRRTDFAPTERPRCCG